MWFGLGEWGCRQEGDPCHTHLPHLMFTCQRLGSLGRALGPMHSPHPPPPQDEAKVLTLLEELLAGSPTPGSAQLQVDPQQKEKKVTRI